MRNFQFDSEHLWRRCLILVEFWSRRYLISSIEQREKLILYIGAWIEDFMRPEKHWLRMKFKVQVQSFYFQNLTYLFEHSIFVFSAKGSSRLDFVQTFPDLTWYSFGFKSITFFVHTLSGYLVFSCVLYKLIAIFIEKFFYLRYHFSLLNNTAFIICFIFREFWFKKWT